MGPEKETVRVRLSYPLARVKEPIIYHLIVDHRLVPNVERAHIDVHTGGFLMLWLTGDKADLARGLRWLESCGITVEALRDDEA
jgi:hypothetical protein